MFVAVDWALFPNEVYLSFFGPSAFSMADPIPAFIFSLKFLLTLDYKWTFKLVEEGLVIVAAVGTLDILML